MPFLHFEAHRFCIDILFYTIFAQILLKFLDIGSLQSLSAISKFSESIDCFKKDNVQKIFFSKILVFLLLKIIVVYLVS